MLLHLSASCGDDDEEEEEEEDEDACYFEPLHSSNDNISVLQRSLVASFWSILPSSGCSAVCYPAGFARNADEPWV